MAPSIDSRPVQDRIAFLMLSVAAAVFGYLSKTATYPLLMCGLAAVGLTTSLRMTLVQDRRVLGALVLAGIFLAKWVVAPYQPPDTRVFLQYALAYDIGQCFLTMQALQFLIRRSDERLSSAFPLWGTAVLISAADIYVTRTQFIMYESAVIAYVLLASGFYGAARRFTATAARRSRLRPCLAAFGLVLAGLGAGGGCLLLARHWDDLERWFDPHHAEPQLAGVGFGRQSRLGSVEFLKNKQAEAVAVRVYASQSPGYLRGAAFDSYARGCWDFTATYRVVNPVRLTGTSAPEDLHNIPVYSVRDAGSELWSAWQIWKDPSMPADAMFLPLTACLIETQAESLSIDDYDVAMSSTLAGGDCTAWIPHTLPLVRAPRPMRQKLTEVPPEFLTDPQLQKLVRDVFQGCQTSEEKVAAVEDWFHRNYSYSTSVQVPRRTEPMRWFLLERPSAHCEFFASGAALLLRMEGVPCRYVTGFVADERNSSGGYWIARNKDAHAWVEAYVPDQGWVVVEATPGEGVSTPQVMSRWSAMADDLLLRFQILRTQLTRGGWRGLVLGLWQLFVALFTSIPGMILSAGLFAWTATLVMRSLRWRADERLKRRPTPAQQRLADMDRRLRRHSLVRQPSETLHQFAARLRAAATHEPSLNHAADWYINYARSRYGGSEASAAMQLPRF